MTRTVRHRFATAIALGIVVSALAGINGLRADCAAPQPFVCPCATTSVPPDPHLTLFWPHRYWSGTTQESPTVAIRDSSGHALPFRLIALPGTDAYATFSLSVSAPAGTRFTVTLDPERLKLAQTYTVDPQWSHPEPPAWGYQVDSRGFAWACSFERTTTLSLPAGPSSVYRLEWRPADSSLPARSLYLPAQRDWHHTRGQSRAARDTLPLGHSSCLGWNFRWDDPAIVLQLYAVYPDGSEGPASPSIRLTAPPRFKDLPRYPDTPTNLSWPEEAWRSLLSALRSGRPSAVQRVCTASGWVSLRRALGSDPDAMTRVAEAWDSSPIRWVHTDERVAEGRRGPEVKEQAFRFVKSETEWQLDEFSPGE